MNGVRHFSANARFLIPLNRDRHVSRLWLFPKVKIFVASTIWPISGVLAFIVAQTMQAWGDRTAR